MARARRLPGPLVVPGAPLQHRLIISPFSRLQQRRGVPDYHRLVVLSPFSFLCVHVFTQRYIREGSGEWNIDPGYGRVEEVSDV